MKKIFTLSICALLLAGVITISSCNSDPLIVPYNFGEQEVCLPASATQGYQVFTYDIHHADVTAALTAAGITDLGRVTTAKLKTGFKAKISTTGSNFDQISNIEVYMKLTGTGGTGDQIAYSDVLATGATETTLLVNGTEMKQAVTSDITLTVKVLNKLSGNNPVCVKLTDGTINVSVRK